jgi:hypothetical protein
MPEPSWQAVETRLLSATGEILMCAGLGAIVEPYVVAYTRRHFLAIADLDTSTRRDLIDAFDLCLESKLFPSGFLSVFEHGGRSDGSTTACLEHCHMHIIDGQFDLREQMLSAFPEAETVSISEDESIASESSYLFAGIYRGEGVTSGRMVHSPGCGSQFFRRLLATQVNEAEWNWRLWPKPEAARALCERWSIALQAR